MQSLFDWLDHRLEYRRYWRILDSRVLPDGPSWLYTSASCLLWLLAIQCLTGLLLMASYSPSMASAWASVSFIDQSNAGRFLRGLHHYLPHAIIIVMTVHLARVLILRDYRPPRELVWITGLMMFPLIIVWIVTGNPLTASQKGISQIQVEGNILAATPVCGPWLQRLLFGGAEVGNLTLTRLYFLHVGLLPLVVVTLCLIHLHQVVKHSSYRQHVVLECAELPVTRPYWPYQTSRNVIVLGLIIGLIAWISLRWGPPLPAPADPELPYSPRPEWYFRWLFELRRYFTGNTEFVATLVVPLVGLGLLLTAPILDRMLPARYDRLCRVLIIVVCATGWGSLTLISFRRDWQDQEYLASQVEFENFSDRARYLVRTQPMPPQGAIELLRQDPVTQGPRLFARHCRSCHSLSDANGSGIVAQQPSAPNLYGIGTTSWISGFLHADKISSRDYFANTRFLNGDMQQHIQSLFDDNQHVDLDQKLDFVALALAAESGHEPYDSSGAEQGRKLLAGELNCTECHKFAQSGSLGSAPDLTGYASPEWLRQMISDPGQQRFYGSLNDRMPSFVTDPTHPQLNLLTNSELDLLVNWLSSSAMINDQRQRDHDLGAASQSPQ